MSPTLNIVNQHLKFPKVSLAAGSNYSIINHCRWDTLGQVLPSLIFKKSFHSCVLDNFAANNVAAMPVLYRLA